MNTSNTTVTEFIILGFPGLNPKYDGLVAAVLFVLYLIIIGGNLLILVFVCCERSLHKPTYLIFCHLAMNDLLFGTVTLPKMISRYWLDDRIIPFSACFTQMYFVHSLGAIHSIILLIMALDRFIAICVPLRYPALITTKNISIVCLLSWALTFLSMSGVMTHALNLSYCASNVIIQCYCDFISISSLGCGKEEVKFAKSVAVGYAMFRLNPKYDGLVAAFLFVLYLIIIGGNLLILVFVCCERSLHKPTYLIFCHLAMNDLLFGTVTLPKMISRYWLDDRIIPFSACFTQMYFVHSLGAIHSIILLIMALDRFIAICVPLRYPALITTKNISIVCLLSWALTFLRMSGVMTQALNLSYCASNVIIQCYCDFISISSLGCGKEEVKFAMSVAVGNAMFISVRLL
ncbi:unnamed protein product [Gadus morhua 'NCC']